MSLAGPEVLPVSREAARLLDGASGPLDLLHRLLGSGGLVAAALTAVGAEPAALRQRLPAAEPASAGVEGVVRNASREALLLGHRRIDAIHLLLALLYTDVEATSRTLRENGLSLYDLRAYVQSPAAAGVTERLRAQPRPALRRAVGVSPVFLGLAAVWVTSGVLLYRGVPSGLVTPATLLFVASGWIVSLCLHEFGHALVAYVGGDRSVAEAGYLRLDPLAYVNPLFSIVLPVVFVLLGGIGLPGGAVYVDLRALRSRAWESLVPAAGPLATLLFALVVALPFTFAPDDWFSMASIDFWAALAFLVVVEFGALILNLLPIPPLDGFGVLSPLLSWQTRLAALRIGNVALLVLFLLLWTGPAAQVFWTAVFFLAALVNVPPELAALGRQHMLLGG